MGSAASIKRASIKRFSIERENEQKVCVIDHETKAKLYPPCGVTLDALCSYLRCRRHDDAEQDILARVIAGETPISDIEKFGITASSI